MANKHVSNLHRIMKTIDQWKNPDKATQIFPLSFLL